MAFCIKEKKLIDGGVTCVDNKFILNYLPDAPDKCVAVYLLGLALSDSEGTDNACSAIAQKLGITAEEVMAAYLYWDELGLVHITTDNPPRILYLDARGAAGALKKVKPSKYSKFNKEMQSAFESRMLTPNEYYAYYDFLENTTFEPEALVAVAKYCVALKGGDVNFRYLLTVARNLLMRGVTTLAVVQDSLNSQQKYDEDLKLVFKALGLNRAFEYADRETYEKWIKDFGFSADVIVKIAKDCKGRGMAKLDANLTEYYKKGALSLSEIDHYKTEKEHLTELAKQINRAVGVYYQSVEAEIDEYVVAWVRKGYDDETLLAVAKYCFKSGIRTLQGLANVIDKLYKNGITTVAALNEYFAETTRKDETIKAVLNTAGIERNVTNNDRTLFSTWKKWNVSDELIFFAAERSAGTNSPMSYINRLLANYKQQGIATVAQAQAKEKATAATAAKKAVVGAEIAKTDYTEEQLNALFTALDETEE
ncbi:MAG: DnaD domain protein [Corallococcus sp.]|nr:DnaD domain protein [Corallococcus sp.]MCM1359563.1 DnaD domain protein [Corallococcus sp.]MCM1395155.1 DnaD domain protein [Corallococcus sp.]